MKTEGSGGSMHNWCRRRGLEQQRFYEITKLKEQFQEILLVGGENPSNDRGGNPSHDTYVMFDRV